MQNDERDPQVRHGKLQLSTVGSKLAGVMVIRYMSHIGVDHTLFWCYTSVHRTCTSPDQYHAGGKAGAEEAHGGAADAAAAAQDQCARDVSGGERAAAARGVLHVAPLPAQVRARPGRVREARGPVYF
ncbi:unnamed protein product [Phytophthora fragariaefolia]|uniref:Unnamed protein product n=1 Tax=Phytophthora fragariaefolia TaxID=1490495 RepID=A0A9W7D0N8_9STRA|nr:unnamed protein product [Phytophthora fragariaefolia]